MSSMTHSEYETAAIVMLALSRGIDLNIDRSSPWAARVTVSLWPKSQEKLDPVKMFNEWMWNRERTQHKGSVVLPCDLCGHPETIYKFRLHNAITERDHMCGSVCVRKFLERSNNIAGSTYNIEAEFKLMQEIIRREKENERRTRLLEAISNSDLYSEFKQSIMELHQSNKCKVAKVSPKQAVIIASAVPRNACTDLVINLKPRKYMADAVQNIEAIKHILTQPQLNAIESRISRAMMK